VTGHGFVRGFFWPCGGDVSVGILLENSLNSKKNYSTRISYRIEDRIRGRSGLKPILCDH